MGHRFTLRAVIWIVVSVLTAGAAGADDIKEVSPDAQVKGRKSRGKLCSWKSADGLQFNYRVPKDYDHDKGASLTFILHGSNLSRGWGFANHSYKTFRPDDIVVSPDGTTPNGNGGFNFMGEKKDAKRLHGLHEELKKTFNIKATYLYGHSQGSFFSFYYAGEYPEDVNGVVGHASGVWNWTTASKKGHHQAIVLMHGTQDPVVPYVQSAADTTFTDRKYPMVRKRHLEWWNHWPAEHNGDTPHTSQQLAWVEGMTTTDMDRLTACWDVLTDVKKKEEHDYAGVYLLAKRIVELEGAPGKCKKSAENAIKVVDELVKKHIDAIQAPEDLKFADEDWITQLGFFMRRFEGVPAADSYVETFAQALEKQQKDAVKHLKKYFKALNKGKQADAFKEGIAAIEKGFLWPETIDNRIRNNLKDWAKDAKKLKIPKKVMKDYEAIAAVFDKRMQSGWKAFSKINAKAGKL